MKKQKLAGGGAIGTASAKKTGPTTRKSKLSFLDIPVHENKAFLDGKFLWCLNKYLHSRDGSYSKPVFEVTKKEEEVNGSKKTIFIASCKVGMETGKGCGSTWKYSKKMACLDIIQKFGLVPKEKMRDVMAIPERFPKPKKKKRKKKPMQPLIERKVYLQGNFRLTLQQHLQVSNPGAKISFEHKEETCETGMVHTTTCKVDKLEYEGVGRAKNRKKSIHLSCVDYMLKMGILTDDEHSKKHPDATNEFEADAKKGLVDAWADQKVKAGN